MLSGNGEKKTTVTSMIDFQIPEIEWIRKKARFSNGWVGKVNHWRLFSIDWNSSHYRSNRDMEKGEHTLHCFLPGIVDAFPNLTVEMAEKKAEVILSIWLQKLFTPVIKQELKIRSKK